MAYQLQGRALPKDFNDETLSRCIFCGTQMRHLNGEKGKNNAMVVNALYAGAPRSFYYCNTPCPQQRADRIYEESIWQCGCVRDYIENVGDVCVNCKRPRDEAAAAGDDSGHRVHVLEGRVVFKTVPTDRELCKLEETLDGVVGPNVRVVLDGQARSVPAEDYDLVEPWFEAQG